MAKQHMVVQGLPKFWLGWAPFLDDDSLSCKVQKEDVVTLMAIISLFIGCAAVQKLLNLEQVEVEAEEEPEGNTIIGSSEEALRPLYGYYFYLDKFLLCSGVFGKQPP